MTNNPQVVIDPAALDAMLHDPDGPVGDILKTAGDEIAIVAAAAAPIGFRGSKFSPPGTLKLLTRRSVDVHLDSDGELAIFVGSPLYPHNFIDAEAGFTRNPGNRSVRRADNKYLEDSLDAGIVWP